MEASHYNSELIRNTIVLPLNSNWRHWRVRRIEADGSHKWFKYPFTLDFESETSLKKFIRWLGKIKPSDVYFTIGKWLNPKGLSSRHARGRKGGGYERADSLLLGGDFVFDADHEDSFKEVLLANEYFSRNYPNYSRTIVSTGRGHQLIIHDVYKGTNESAYKRVLLSLRDELRACGFKWDEMVSIDPRRLVRAWGSCHRNGRMAGIIATTNDRVYKQHNFPIHAFFNKHLSKYFKD